MRLFKEDCQFDTVVIIGKGKVSADQLEAAMTQFSIAIETGAKQAYWANLLFGTGRCVFENNKNFPYFAGDMKISFGPTPYTDVKDIKTIDTERWAPNPGVSGFWDIEFEALHLAMEFKPKKILLIGFKPDAGIFDREMESDFQHLANSLAAKGVSVYNCSLDTDLKAFKRELLFNVL